MSNKEEAKSIDPKYYDEILNIISEYKTSDEYQKRLTYDNVTRIHAAANIPDRLLLHKGDVNGKIPNDEIMGLISIIHNISEEHDKLLDYLESPENE